MNNLFFVFCILTILAACTTNPPKNTDNLCEIFRENDDWYSASLRSAQRWGTPIAVQMAIINQESSFIADAEPPQTLILGFIPWFNASSAYGYAQAKDETWAEYQHKTGNHWADREDFSDSCDFVAWYCSVSHKKLSIAFVDSQNLYLSYHEGWTGYQHQSYVKKPGLAKVANKVAQRALRYDAQLSSCKSELESKN